ncbi:MAG TPA: hypothetical protein VLT16_04425 [Candidatus Limnocylindrales bacterium]|nr:hypothetical protein [Candidatus Limnocylindrales bacterium]
MAVLSCEQHLKVYPKDGFPGDEYRIRAGRVEVRAVGPDGEPYPLYDEWILVTPEEIKLHFVRRSPVARWLKEILERPAAGGEKPKQKELATTSTS